MKTTCLLYLVVVFGVIVASGQDCRPDNSTSLANAKDSVRRAMTMNGYTGWDDKVFSRAGDMAAVAIMQTLSKSEITSPDTMKLVLNILRVAFSCPSHCVTAPSDRQPNVTMLLIEHLKNTDSGRTLPEINEVRDFILLQTRDLE